MCELVNKSLSNGLEPLIAADLDNSLSPTLSGGLDPVLALSILPPFHVPESELAVFDLNLWPDKVDVPGLGHQAIHALRDDLINWVNVIYTGRQNAEHLSFALAQAGADISPEYIRRAPEWEFLRHIFTTVSALGYDRIKLYRNWEKKVLNGWVKVPVELWQPSRPRYLSKKRMAVASNADVIHDLALALAEHGRWYKHNRVYRKRDEQLERLLEEVVSRSGEALELFRGLLNHPDCFVRCWAAVELFDLGYKEQALDSLRSLSIDPLVGCRSWPSYYLRVLQMG